MSANLLRTLKSHWKLAMSSEEGASVSSESNQENVFMHYTQKDLDRNYTQSEWAPNLAHIMTRFDHRSQLTRQRLGNPERYEYGDNANSAKIEGLDLFRSASPNAPVQVYIHGGAWRSGSASIYHFPADMFVAAGISYIALDFDSVENVGLDGMMAQIRKAMVWIYHNAAKLGIDKNRIHLSGHSSGAHLGGVLLTTQWNALGLPLDLIKSATLISGMYDLLPVRLSARSSYVPFDDFIEQTLSSQRQAQQINTPVVLAYGGLETDEFKRQTCTFYETLKAHNKQVDLLYLETYNHFEIMDDFGNPYSPISEATIRNSLS